MRRLPKGARFHKKQVFDAATTYEASAGGHVPPRDILVERGRPVEHRSKLFAGGHVPPRKVPVEGLRRVEHGVELYAGRRVPFRKVLIETGRPVEHPRLKTNSQSRIRPTPHPFHNGFQKAERSSGGRAYVSRGERSINIYNVSHGEKRLTKLVTFPTSQAATFGSHSVW
mmetsp:Transcript_35255/g.81617  ORF Transcript_35255/g.81617 Transcript_35255/m.81617 type:complete len:170 (-) Transcript_35255:342-851(-)